MPRSPALAVELADTGSVLSPASYDPAAANPCPGSNSVPSRHSAKRMPASFRASATAAVALPCLAAILVTHSCRVVLQKILLTPHVVAKAHTSPLVIAAKIFFATLPSLVADVTRKPARSGSRVQQVTCVVVVFAV